jgi:glycosyltransferase involved in cell wall biosynthesis
VTTSAGGGAGRAARRINAALRATGHGSFIVCGDITSRAEGIIKLDLDTGAMPAPAKLVRKFAGDFLQFKYIERLRDKRKTNTLFSAGLDGAHRLPALHPVGGHHPPALDPAPAAAQQHPAAARGREADGLDAARPMALHRRLPLFRRLRPLPDHCSPCAQLRKDPWNLPAILQADKAAAFSRGLLTVVAPSAWMADCARASTIFRGARVEVVRNPIETEVFRPLPPEQRRDLRQRIGVSEDEHRPGRRRQHQCGDPQGLRPADRGPAPLHGRRRGGGAGRRPAHLGLRLRPPGRAIEEPGVGFMDFGSIDNDATLSSILSMADLVLLPSREDNYPT